MGHIPPTRPADLAAEKARTGDPYASRIARGRQPLVTVQLDYAEDEPLYTALDRADLRTYADVLRFCLALLGVRSGDTIAIFEFGTSPVAYLASSLYTPYLTSGAADALGCATICNDGVPAMSQRAVEILKYVRPRYFVLRAECVQPFASACEADGIQASRYLEAVVVTQNEDVADSKLRALCRDRLGVPLYLLPRADLALFLGIECPECGLVHASSDHYVVEALDVDDFEPARPGTAGFLAITNRFARVCPAIRVLTALEGYLVPGECRRGPDDLRLCL